MTKLFRKLALLVPVPLLVALTNVSVDPAHLFSSRYEEGAVEILLSGRNVANLAEYDERVFARLMAERMPRAPEVLVLGSSRAMLISSRLFPGKRVFNSAMSSATLPDLVGATELYRHRMPQAIVIGVDPWLFSAEFTRRIFGSQGIPLSEPYRQALVRWGSPVPAEIARASEGDRQRERWLELLSPSYFQASLGALARRATGSDTGTYSPTERTEAEGFVRLVDGSRSYPAQVRQRTAPDVAAEAARYAAGGVYFLMRSHEQLDPGLQAVFLHWIDELLARRVRLSFFLPPDHPIVHERMASRASFSGVPRTEAWIREQAGRRGIEVIGSYDPHACGLKGEDFHDATHARRDVVEALLGQGRR